MLYFETWQSSCGEYHYLENKDVNRTENLAANFEYDAQASTGDGRMKLESELGMLVYVLFFFNVQTVLHWFTLRSIQIPLLP